MLKIESCTVDYIQNPIGITTSPRFQWKISSSLDNTVQQGYELQIAITEDFQELLYIEKKESEQSTNVVLENFQMESLTKYFFRVKIYDNHGNESNFSEVYYFITGYLDSSEWNYEFITIETEMDSKYSFSSYLRKEFKTDRDVDYVYICATALGLYKLYLDGEQIGQDELKPGWTSYHNHLLYQMYDITSFFKNDSLDHCIGAHIGAGWYKGKMGIMNIRNNYGTRTGFLCQIHIGYKDGRKQVIGTDQTWVGTRGPVDFAEIYDGEVYDARKEIIDWNKFRNNNPEGQWESVTCIENKKYNLFAQYAAKVIEKECMKPQKILFTPKNEKVIDFGQNMAGWVHVKLSNVKKGDCLKLHFFEILDKDGNVYTENLRDAKQSLIYYCKGDTQENYHPSFTYMGFRYIHVEQWPGDWDENSIEARALYSDMKETGNFSCSHSGLNHLYSNILWGMKSNFVDIPTDCPQRDERMGWTGDAQIFSKTACYLMNTEMFFEKWMRDLAFDQTAEGGVPHVVPDIITPWQGIGENWLLDEGSHSASAWSDAAVLIPWNVYLSTGDIRILKNQYTSMKKWIQFMEQHANGPKWSYRLQLGDWLALDAEPGSYFGATPTEFTSSAYYYLSTYVFSEIACVLGKEEDARYYKDLANEVLKGIQEEYFDQETGSLKIHTQTAHIVALYFNLVTEENRRTVTQNLVQLLDKENGHLVTGFIGTPYFCHALSENGCLKEAYDLLLKEDYPSWLYQVNKGATTIWEHWDGIRPDGTMWSADMNSFNHYAYGSIGDWLIRVVAGISSDEKKPGYKHIHFYPRPGGNIMYVKSSYQSMYGIITCEWKQEEDLIMVECEVPPNTQADFRLDSVSQVVENEKKIPFQLKDKFIFIELGSGKYQFTFQISRD